MSVNPVIKLFASIQEVNNFTIDIFEALNSFEKSFYFEQPDKEITYCGLGSLISFSSDKDYGFTQLGEKVKNISLEINEPEFKDLLFPVVLGGMKFPKSSSVSDDGWCDYKNSDWFVPEYLLLIKKGKCRFISFGTEKANAGKSFDEFKCKLENSKEKKTANKPEVYPIQNISKYKWHLLVDNAVSEIKKNTFSKVVLSRKAGIDIIGEMNFRSVMEELRDSYVTCTLFIFKSGGSHFFGATPEKAASFMNGIAEFDALAGSAPRGFDKLTDSRYEKYLLNSTKDRDEHNYVISYIKNESASLVKDFVITETVVKKLNNIQHLFTGISAEIKEPSFMFPLLDKVIPTPAVCGLPKESALDFIIENEGYSRGLYAGTIGWFNLNYEGEFMAALRSALYKNNKLSIFAGCGIVENSDPATEYEETELKMQPIRSIFL